MACTIYLGASVTTAPPSPFWENPSIQPSTADIHVAETISVGVTARNNGTDAAPPTLLELFWTDPTTGFIAIASQQIGTFIFENTSTSANAIPPATALGGDGHISTNMSWLVPSAALGHVCLLARLSNLTTPGCSQATYRPPPETDPMQAIHNIHVSEAALRGKARMAFAFAATNIMGDDHDTQLRVVALDPKSDRHELEALTEHTAVYRALRNTGLKFGAAQTSLSEGRERMLVDPRLVASRPIVATVSKALAEHGSQGANPPCNNCAPPRPGLERAAQPAAFAVPRSPSFRFSGTLDERTLSSLRASAPLDGSDGSKPIPLNLLQFERRQMILEVTPQTLSPAIHVVRVFHENRRGEAFGGLTVIFAPRHNFFH